VDYYFYEYNNNIYYFEKDNLYVADNDDINHTLRYSLNDRLIVNELIDIFIRNPSSFTLFHPPIAYTVIKFELNELVKFDNKINESFNQINKNMII
jgi:hypothetical protein